MKVLFVTDGFGYGYGVTSLLLEEVEYLKKHGVSCIVLGCRYTAFLYVKKLFSNARCYSYEIKTNRSLLRNVLIILHSYFLTIHIVKREKPNCIHTNTVLSAFGVVLAYPFHKCPMVYHFHGPWHLEIDSLVQYFIKNTKHPVQKSLLIFANAGKTFIRRMMQQACIKGAKQVIVLSLYSRRILLDNFSVNPSRLVVIPGSVNTKLYYIVDKYRAKKALGIHPKTFVVSLIARPEPRKGIHVALHAMEQVVFKTPRCLCLIGTSEYDSSYINHEMSLLRERWNTMSIPDVQQLGSSIVFRVAATRTSTIKLLQAADIFLMSSVDLETFGITTIEAMACGAIVVGTPTGATPEILGQLKSYNLLTKDSSAGSIMEKIIDIMKLPAGKRERIVSEEVDVIHKKYTSGKVLNTLLTVYQSVANDDTG